MVKEIKYKEEAREAVFQGINKVADTVKCTLGPKGRYVAIDDESGVQIINDGVTVAKSISLENNQQEAGAKLVKEVASKTQDLAGDGTTTATVLAQAITKEGLKYINSGANPIEIKKGIEKASKNVVDYLKKQVINIDSKEQISSIASISANNDEEIGNLIAEGMEKVGNDGVITVEEASATEMSVDTTQGMEFDKGYLSPYMVTDNEKKEVSLDNPYILVTDKKISSLKEILPALQAAGEESKPLLIIAEEVEGEALSGLVLNLIKGTIKAAAVKAPGFGDEMKEKLRDIASLTGARAIIQDEGIELKDISSQDLGSAKRVKVTKDKTTIVEASGENLQDRINLLKNQIELAESETEKTNLKKRLASLTGGVAVLKIGASTETEMKDKKHRVDDALNATRAAVEEGIIVGGGVALLKASKQIDENSFEGDQKLGAHILKEALKYPFSLILENGGLDSSIIRHKVLESEEFNHGYNAKSDEYQNLVDNGVIDPFKVNRLALENATSIASMILTTESLVVEKTSEGDENHSANFPPAMM